MTEAFIHRRYRRAQSLLVLAMFLLQPVSVTLAQSGDEPQFRGTRLLSEELRPLDLPVARFLVLETWKLALSRAQEAARVTDDSQRMAQLTALVRDQEQRSAVASRELKACRSALARTVESRPATDTTRDAWIALIDHLLGRISVNQARLMFERTARNELDAYGQDSELDAQALVAKLWPLPFLRRLNIEASAAAHGRNILESNAFFPAARRGDLTLSFPASYLAALGLSWVESQRYQDCLFYLLDSSRLPTVLPEAVGLASILRALALEKRIANAGNRSSTNAPGPEQTARTIIDELESASEALASCLPIAAAPPSAETATEPALAGSPAPRPTPAAGSRRSRRRSAGGFFIGVGAGLVALLLVVVWRKLRGRPVWLHRPAGGASLLLATLVAGASVSAGIRALAGDPPDSSWTSRAPQLVEVPPGLTGVVLLDGSPISITDLAHPPSTLGHPRLLLPAGRHRLRLGSDVKTQLIDSGRFLAVYSRLRERASSAAGLARLVRDHGEHPHDPMAPHLIGNHLADSDEGGAAREAWFRALETNVAFVPAIANLSISMGHDGSRPRARSLAAVALAIDPGNAYGLATPLRLELEGLGIDVSKLPGEASLSDLVLAREATRDEHVGLDRIARGVVRFHHGLAKLLPDRRERAKATSNAGLYLQTRGMHRQAARMFRKGIARLRHEEAPGRWTKIGSIGGLEFTTNPAPDPVAATIYTNLIRSLEHFSPAEARIYRLVLELERAQ